MQIKPVREIEEFLRPVAEGAGCELVEVKWSNRDATLTVVIDAAGGVDMDLCEKFHRAADVALDALDPTFGAAYTLTCSSPGLDRPFKTARDFARHMGEKIEVHFYAPFEGTKYLEGTLLAFEGDTIRLQTEKGVLEIPFAKTSKVCLLIEV